MTDRIADIVGQIKEEIHEDYRKRAERREVTDADEEYFAGMISEQEVARRNGDSAYRQCQCQACMGFFTPAEPWAGLAQPVDFCSPACLERWQLEDQDAALQAEYQRHHDDFGTFD